MSEYGIDEFIRRAEQRIAFDRSRLTSYDGVSANHAERLQQLEQRLHDALASLAYDVLGTLDESSVTTWASRNNAPDVEERWYALVRTRGEKQRALEAVEADPRWATRQAMTMASAGVLPAQIEELQPMLTEAEETYGRLHHQRLGELVSKGWGTPTYPHQRWTRFFNSEFLRDWEAADALVERSGCASWDELVTLWDEARIRRDTFRASMDDLQDQLRNIQQLEERHAKALAYITGFEAHLAATLGALLEARRCGSHERLTILDGLRHQIDYLNRIIDRVRAERAAAEEKLLALEQERDRYRNDAFRYRNKRFTADQLSRRLGVDEERFAATMDRYDSLGATIVAFDAYTKASALQDFLWWDVITDGRLDGNFIPEVASWRGERPGYTWTSDTPTATFHDIS
ncbi:MAG: hypothetical protein MUC47_01240 [Candidatus Kapabacteria bacterium]|jgi:hypothetical protein|nr:hypothetical protein [Candidatus Kapabacteria bacterium]